MFLLVPAYPGSPGPPAVKQSCVCMRVHYYALLLVLLLLLLLLLLKYEAVTIGVNLNRHLGSSHSNNFAARLLRLMTPIHILVS